VALNLGDDSRAALELAKRSLPEGEALGAGLLMASLYYGANLEDAFPRLAALLEEPMPIHRTAPEKVPLEESLRYVLADLDRRGNEPLSAEEWLRVLMDSQAGRAFLESKGQGTEASSWRESPERSEAIEALSSFGRMLTITEPPHRGVVGVDRALTSLQKTLLKQKRRNAIVIGPPGTGKSALIYEFARMIVAGDEALPERLRDLDIFELSPSFLRSGASMVGQYDERVKELLGVLEAHPKIVLFVDEIHSLFQSSMHHRGPFSEANESFKSALSRGTISCIGCTTTAEFRHYIEPDGALQRRFGIIKLEPPTRDATVHILQARLPRLEKHYAPLRVPEAILEKAVDLTDEYLPGRFQPDKSIQLVDEACAICSIAKPPPEEVTEEALVSALEDTIGHSVARAETLTEESVFERLRSKIVGQDEALRGISRAFIAGLGGWKKTKGPRGRFFFCGPTGVGKTQTALVLAEMLSGGHEALLRIDCNTLQGSGRDAGPAINRLLGAPPGYIGYVAGQGGILSKIRDVPESIVLFDEIEKADPGVGKVLLQILDDGRVDDNDGNPLDFRRAYLIFTTNAGCTYDTVRSLGFGRGEEPEIESPRVDVDAVMAELRAIGHGEEFLGRNLQFFSFQGMDADAIRIIMGRQLESLRETADLRGYELTWDAEIEAYLASQWQPRFGVRHLTTILRNRVTEQLSVAEAQGELKDVAEIRLQVLPLGEGQEERKYTGLATRERRGRRMVILLA
jgi:ATP-dependent Clp protease ATP-binding subunit ClpA